MFVIMLILLVFYWLCVFLSIVVEIGIDAFFIINKHYIMLSIDKSGNHYIYSSKINDTTVKVETDNPFDPNLGVTIKQTFGEEVYRDFLRKNMEITKEFVKNILDICSMIDAGDPTKHDEIIYDLCKQTRASKSYWGPHEDRLRFVTLDVIHILDWTEDDYNDKQSDWLIDYKEEYFQYFGKDITVDDD